MTEIKEQLKKGVFWSALDKYTVQVVGIFITMILARLITPAEFGIVATASVLLAFLSIFTSVGIGPAIIQRKDLDQEDVNQIFTFMVLLGIMMGAISFVSSWIIADFYGNPTLRPVVQILSVGLLLSSLNVVPAALMSKNLRFKEMATRSISFQFFFGCIGAIAAYYGAGVYSLICPQIASSICTFFYNNHFYPVRVKTKIRISPIKKIFSYSIFVFLSHTTNYFSRNLDKILIGKVLSASALGYYDKSYRLMQMPLTNISSVISPVMQPILSKYQNDKEVMSQTYTKIVEKIASLSFPISIILFFSAEDIISVMYGDMWLPAVPSFRILALSIPLSLLSNPNGPVYLACNATKEMFITTLIGTLLIIASFFIAAFYFKTIESFAWAWTLNELFGTTLSYFMLYIVVLKDSLVPVIKVLIKPLLSALVLTITFLLYEYLVSNEYGHIVHLIFKGIIGVIFVLAVLKASGQFDVYALIKKNHII